jgi:hypothetical protein
MYITMSILNLFGKKDQLPKTKDFVWISQTEKLQGLLSLLSNHPDATILAWFSETKSVFENFLAVHGKNIDIKIAGKNPVNNQTENTIIFLEHYPLRSTETTYMQNWIVKNVIVINALDEPLFETFGSTRIIQMMKTMGLKANEFLEHPFITKSIENAQHKLEKRVINESTAFSSRDWFVKNIKILNQPNF